jgi:surface protein
VEVDWRLATGAEQFLLNASDGSFDDILHIYVTTASNLTMRIRSNNTLLTNAGESASSYSGIQKIALAYKTDDFELYRNGSSIATGTGSLAALATLTDIDIGQSYGANSQVNMWIRAVALYRKRLGTEDLINLTGDNPSLFTTTWATTGSGETITLPLISSGTYDFYVNWGDGTTTDHITAYNQAEVTHTYASAGTYTVRIFGTIRGFRFANGGDRLKILTIDSYGSLDISTNQSFYGCNNLTSTATDAPTISTTNLFATFTNCTNFNGAIGNWNVSSVTSMASMFNGASAFNQDISGWDVSSVTNMNGMFQNASSFNQYIGGWTIRNDGTAINMQNMFYVATSFNQDISGWDVSNVTNMFGMFVGTPFNQNISGWDVSSVNSMAYMFNAASSFNQDIGSWDVSKVGSMAYMFNAAVGMSAANLGAVKDWTITALTDGTNFQSTSANSMSTSDYDALLIAWAGQTHKNNVTIHFNQAVRSSASDTAFNQLIADGWTITDSSGTTT